jgi:hypothetical protein
MLSTASSDLLLVRTIADPVYSVVTADHGYTLRFTNPAGCTVTVDAANVVAGVCVTLIQENGGAAVQLAFAGGMLAVASASFTAPYATFDDGSVIGITVLDATHTSVYGKVA